MKKVRLNQMLYLLFASMLFVTHSIAQTRVVGYLPTWNNLAADAGNVDYSVVTHVNVAFSNPNASLSGDLDIPAGLLTASQRVHAGGAKILLSIAGAEGDPYSYVYLLNAARVDNFVSRLVQATATYQLDGIDVDIEGRVFEGGLSASSYETFIRKLATALHAQNKLITCAIATSYANSITSAAAQQFDFVNIMSYDARGPWTPNSPGQHSSYQMAVDDVNYWHTVKGVAKNKLVVGVPFYGYGWGTYGANGAVGAYTFRDIVNRYPGAENVDQQGSGANALYYNGIPTIKAKTTFGKNEAGGIMIWQLLGDATGSKSLLAAIKSIIGTTTPNQSPTVNLTSPANNSTFNAPATLSITANAADADGSVTRVEFFNGSTSLGFDATAPYTFSWTNVTAGTYTITARATDNAGAVTTSGAVTVIVNTVSVPQSPYGGTAWSIPGTIEAERYDLGGQGVAFNDNTTANQGGAFRTDAVDVEPYGNGFNVGYIVAGEWLEYTVNVTAGTYNIQAYVAATTAGKTFRLELDGSTIGNFTVPNTGAWGTFQSSAVNSVTLTAGQKVLRIYATTGDFNIDRMVFTTVVTNPNVAPTVALTAPANNATFTAPATLNLTANAADADGTVSRVEFFNGTVSLGSDLSAPYAFTWNNVAAGTYTFTARATDNSGAVTTSSAVTVVVNSVTPTQTPYGSVFGTIPGTIEAERYDLGGQGIAYNDVTPANEGGAFRTDAVDVEPFSGGFDVGYIVTNEWLEYTVNVTAGTYKIEANVAAIAAGKTFRLELDGATIANFTVPNTGAWGTFQLTTVNNITLTAGQKVLRFYATSTDFNIDRIVFSAAGTTPNVAPAITLTAPANNSNLSAPASLVLTANASDSDGSVSKVEFYNGTQKLGEDLTAPYTYTWTNVAAGNYTISAKATDNTGAATTTSIAAVTVTSPVSPNLCTGIAAYVENGGYAQGNLVQRDGKQYQCKPFPYSGWCNGAAWAYQPGTGAYWADAWTLIGNCNSAARTEASATVNDALLTNAPNPFSVITSVSLETAEAGEVTVAVYNKNGQLIQTLAQGYLTAGSHEFVFDASALQADIYLIKCNTPNGVITRKIVKTE
jgi:GH18 family chitinase